MIIQIWHTKLVALLVRFQRNEYFLNWRFTDIYWQIASSCEFSVNSTQLSLAHCSNSFSPIKVTCDWNPSQWRVSKSMFPNWFQSGFLRKINVFLVIIILKCIRWNEFDIVKNFKSFYVTTCKNNEKSSFLQK